MTLAVQERRNVDPLRTPFGAQLAALARRLGAPPGAAEEAVREVYLQRPGTREEAIAATLAAARAHAPAGNAAMADAAGAAGAGGDGALAAVVAAELRAAHARLDRRQREALALRDPLGLTHAEIARVLGLQSAAVASLLARAQLALHAHLRGERGQADLSCVEREHALRLMARRIDREPVTEAEEDWLAEHLRSCGGCASRRLAMREAATVARLWRTG
jgi:DNA-directed RNA polymerase specialized sigma24 family protein